MSPANDKPFLARRHLYTAATSGAMGSPGFQTVALAESLNPIRFELERLVQGFRPADAGSAQRTRQLLQHPTEIDSCVLSRIEPIVGGPDPRPGNYWAESVVVSREWLDGGEWDLERAFEAIPWLGADQAAEYGGEGLRFLDPEELAPLKPGPLKRLEQLAEIIPGTHLPALLGHLFALVDSDPGRASNTLFLGAGGPALDTQLEAVLPLLLLTLPRSSRSRRSDPATRVLPVRTLGDASTQPLVSVQGVPEELVGRWQGGGILVHLGDEPPEPPADKKARERGERVAALVQEGDWRGVAIANSDSGPVEAAASKSPATAPPDPRQAPLVERPQDETVRRPKQEPRWQAREHAEIGAQALSDRMHDDLEQLLEEARSQFEFALAKHRKTLDAEMQTHLDSIAERAKTALQNIRSTGADEKMKLEQGEVDAIARLKSARGAAVAEIQRMSGSTPAPEPPPAEHAVDRLDVRPPHDGEKKVAQPVLPGALAKTWQWLKQPAVLTTLLAALFVAAALYFVWTSFYRPAPEDPTDPKTQEPAESRNDVLERSRGLAKAKAHLLLKRAADIEALRDEAAGTYLQLQLNRQPLDRDTSCKLLKHLARDVEGFPVTGPCGPKTQSALLGALPAACAALEWPANGACYVSSKLPRFAPESCAASWPFTRDCRWRLEEASALLGELRTAARANDTIDLTSYDLALRPTLAESLDVDLRVGELDQVVLLAHRVHRFEKGDSAPEGGVDELEPSQLAAVAAFLEGLA